jgi:hypothetical protein
MTFFFDRNVPEDAAFALEAMGHQVVRLREVLPTTTATHPPAEVKSGAVD